MLLGIIFLLFLQIKSESNYLIKNISLFEQISFNNSNYSSNQDIVIFSFKNKEFTNLIFSRQDNNKGDIIIYFYDQFEKIKKENGKFVDFLQEDKISESNYQDAVYSNINYNQIYYFVCKFNMSLSSQYYYNYIIMIYNQRSYFELSQNSLIEEDKCFLFRSTGKFQIYIKDIILNSFLHIQFFQYEFSSSLKVIINENETNFDNLNQLNKFFEVEIYSFIEILYVVDNPLINRFCIRFTQNEFVINDILENKNISLYSDGTYYFYYIKDFDLELIDSLNITLNNCYKPIFYCQTTDNNDISYIPNNFSLCEISSFKNDSFLNSFYTIKYQELFSNKGTFFIKINCILYNDNYKQINFISAKVSQNSLFNLKLLNNKLVKIFLIALLFLSIILTIISNNKSIDYSEIEEFDNLKLSNINRRISDDLEKKLIKIKKDIEEEEEILED